LQQKPRRLDVEGEKKARWALTSAGLGRETFDFGAVAGIVMDRAYKTAAMLGHDPMPRVWSAEDALELHKAKASSGMKGSTTYTDLRTSQGMIEFMLRYPSMGPHGCPECEPGEKTGLVAVLIDRWVELEKKIVATGDPSGCARKRGACCELLDDDGWARIWERREREGIPDVQLSERERDEATPPRRKIQKVLGDDGRERWAFVGDAN